MSYQVEKWEEENPNNIDEVPVQPDHFDRRVIVLVEYLARGHDDQGGQQTDPDNHVEGVHPCHAEVEKEQQLGVLLVLMRLELKMEAWHEMLVPLSGVFDPLDYQKHKTKTDSHTQKYDQVLALADLRRTDGQRHRQAAADQHRCICAAQGDVHEPARTPKGVRIHRSVNRITGKHAAEKQHFRDKERPHPQRSRFELLLRIGEMMLKVRACSLNKGLSQLSPLLQVRNCKLLPSLSGLHRNCASLEATRSATPVRLRPRDSYPPAPHVSTTTTGR